MKWVPIRWGNEQYEWIQTASGRWSMLGHEAEVFYTARGWGVMVNGKFLSYYRTRKKAMEAAIGYLAYEKRKKEAEVS